MYTSSQSRCDVWKIIDFSRMRGSVCICELLYYNTPNSPLYFLQHCNECFEAEKRFFFVIWNYYFFYLKSPIMLAYLLVLTIKPSFSNLEGSLPSASFNRKYKDNQGIALYIQSYQRNNRLTFAHNISPTKI